MDIMGFIFISTIACSSMTMLALVIMVFKKNKSNKVAEPVYKQVTPTTTRARALPKADTKQSV